MRVIEAKILDQTHLELTQPLQAKMGDSIKIMINDGVEDEYPWREAGKNQFLEAYDEKDSIYDNL
ncbi:MAG: hypothetical protein HZA01_00125 [Nitrospinae bacterium]|nr:hypothetical protein [Nitrospinota bacterium]